MSKHTPGPWTVSYGNGGEVFVDEAGGRGVARVYGGKGGAIAEATAGLIAAAPDLLAACLDALEDAKYQCRQDAPGVEPDWAKAMRAAITKATGQEG